MRVSCIFAAREIGLDVKTTTIAAESGECDDDYPGIIARLNDGWRIVASRDGTQWVLQRQRGAHRSADDWRARAYCRMRHALENCLAIYVTGDVEPEAWRSSLCCPATS